MAGKSRQNDLDLKECLSNPIAKVGRAAQFVQFFWLGPFLFSTATYIKQLYIINASPVGTRHLLLWIQVLGKG